MDSIRTPKKTRLKDLVAIPHTLRDANLDLASSDWAVRAATDEWSLLASGHGLVRTISAEGLRDDESGRFPEGLNEVLLSFPSAPIHGVHRVREYPYKFDEGKIEAFHTVRILRSVNFNSKVGPRKVLLLHNGLNELDDPTLYYQLASLICKKKPQTVCILRPFPEHLSRYPFGRFSALPLDLYLRDGSLLFRQFLRFMIETRWLLSVVAPQANYKSQAGASLVAPASPNSKGRAEPEILCPAIHDEWERLRTTSVKTLEDKVPGARKFDPESIRLERVEHCVSALRTAMQHEKYASEEFEDPSFHVVGYSLGGFTAQSIFTAWPYLIETCTTLLSGGALRDLAPTAFAHPEEWQTVLHSLRFELDHAMIEGRLLREESNDGHTVAGLDEELYFFLKRTFYDVFQQEHSGAYKTRIAAFRSRMLFVVGGNDPIVNPKSVFDSSPPGGMNLLEIGGIGHFLNRDIADGEESRQRNFWVPEVANIMNRFTSPAGRDLLRTPPEVPDDEPAEPARLSERDQLALKLDGALDGELFQKAVDDLVARMKSTGTTSGHLFVFRNEAPSIFFDDNAMYQHARALFHHDPPINEYVRGLKGRREAMLSPGVAGRVSFVFPHNILNNMRFADPIDGYPSQAETAPGQPDEEYRSDATTTILDVLSEFVELNGSGAGASRVWSFNPNTAFPIDLEGGLQNPPATTLPDAWLWISDSVFEGVEKEMDTLGLPSVSNESPLSKLMCLDAHLKRLRTDDVSNGRRTNTKRAKFLNEYLSSEGIRLIKVSRARFNPRYMGRIVVSTQDVATTISHAALCFSCAKPYDPAQFNADLQALREAQSAEVGAAEEPLL